MPRPLFADAILPELDPDMPALVGVSGGRDSVALLHWLQSQGGRRLVVCHLDHGLRAESRDDAAFVRDLATRLGFPCEVSRSAVAALAKRKKLSLETAARTARHAFFARCARKHRASVIFLAHHADDQAETFLFNLLRGAGLGGLSAMAPVTALGKLHVVRPLLGVWREEIDAYCTAHRLAWREDASNASRDFTRNRLRHDALPALTSAMGRDVRRALWRTAEVLRGEDELMAEITQGLQMGAELEVAPLREMPLAIQRRVLLEWLRSYEVTDIGFEEVERVRTLLTQVRVAKVNLPGGRHARRRSGKLFCE